MRVTINLVSWVAYLTPYKLNYLLGIIVQLARSLNIFLRIFMAVHPAAALKETHFSLILT